MQTPPWKRGAATKAGAQGRLAESSAAPFASQPTIEVVDIKPAQFGAVVAFLTLRIGELTVHGCKVVQQTGQDPWIALPDGKDEATGKWYPIVMATPALKRRITEVVLARWEGGRDG